MRAMSSAIPHVPQLNWEYGEQSWRVLNLGLDTELLLAQHSFYLQILLVPPPTHQRCRKQSSKLSLPSSTRKQTLWSATAGCMRHLATHTDRDIGVMDFPPLLIPEKREVVSIRFTAEDRQVLARFLGIASSGEKSARGLALSETREVQVIGINSASYHAWAYRWQCLEALCSTEELKKERQFLVRVAAINIKNYQLWNHRRRLAFKLGPDSAQAELEFAEHCLEDDPKNYHAWAHRQAVMQLFGLWEQELAYTASMIEADVRNNSAWNQRFFIISASALLPLRAAVSQELDFAEQAILRAPHNESPWNYIRGLASLAGSDRFLVHSTQLHSVCQEILAELPSCSPALSLLADVYMAQMRASAKQGNDLVTRTIADLAAKCMQGLEVADPLHRNYWQLRCRELSS